MIDLRPTILTKEQYEDARLINEKISSVVAQAVNRMAQSSTVSTSAMVKRGTPALLEWVLNNEAEWNKLILMCKMEKLNRELKRSENV